MSLISSRKIALELARQDCPNLRDLLDGKGKLSLLPKCRAEFEAALVSAFRHGAEAALVPLLDRIDNALVGKKE